MATQNKVAKTHKPIRARVVLELIRRTEQESGLFLCDADILVLLNIPTEKEDRARLLAVMATLLAKGFVAVKGRALTQDGRKGGRTYTWVKDMPPSAATCAPKDFTTVARRTTKREKIDEDHGNHYMDGLPMVASVFGWAQGQIMERRV